MPNLSALLEGSAVQFPARDALVLGETRLTYAQVNGAANQVANLLAARGIGAGDKVALSCPNLPYFSIVYYGILKTGATVVPLNVLLKAREIAYHLADSDATAYVCFEGTPDLPMAQEGHAAFEQTPGCEHFLVITADPAAPSPIEGTGTLGAAMAGQPPAFETAEVADDDTAVILYTSGTTGQPKGAELTHANMTSNALVGRELFEADAERPDTYLCTLPLFHSFGQTVIQNSGFAFGGTVVLLGWVGGYGNYTCIQHTGSLSTCYAHQSSFATSQGASVQQGQVIGYIGCTGHCYGDHLHFETRVGGAPVDPMGYL